MALISLLAVANFVVFGALIVMISGTEAHTPRAGHTNPGPTGESQAVALITGLAEDVRGQLPSTRTATPTPTCTPSATATATATETASPTATRTPTRTASPTRTVTPTPTATRTATPTATPTSTPTRTPTLTMTPTWPLAEPVPTSPRSPTPTITPAPVSTSSPVTLGVAGRREYMDEWGNLVIVCDLRNDTPYLVERVQLTGVLYGQDDEVLERQQVTPLLRRIPPHGRAPAVMILGGSQDWTTYALQATGWTAPPSAPSGLVLVRSVAYEDDTGLYRVWGQVRNLGEQPQRFARAVVTLYDEQGQVVNACLAHTVPNILPQGMLGTFNCSFDFARGAVRHVIQLEGE